MKRFLGLMVTLLSLSGTANANPEDFRTLFLAGLGNSGRGAAPDAGRPAGGDPDGRDGAGNG